MKFATASQAARFLDVATPTYLAHENGTRKISPDWAERYGAGFGVSPTWLLFGGASPDMDREVVQGAARPISPRAPARTQTSNPLLSIFEIDARDGQLRPLPGVQNQEFPGLLPGVETLNGFLPELEYVPVAARESRRLVRIQGLKKADGTEQLFAIADFIRLPPSVLRCETAFVMRLRDGDLIDGVSANDYAIIDATQTVPYLTGFYCALIRNRMSLVHVTPISAGLSNQPEEAIVRAPRFSPMKTPLADIEIFGTVAHWQLQDTRKLTERFEKEFGPLEQIATAQQRH